MPFIRPPTHTEGRCARPRLTKVTLGLGPSRSRALRPLLPADARLLSRCLMEDGMEDAAQMARDLAAGAGGWARGGAGVWSVAIAAAARREFRGIGNVSALLRLRDGEARLVAIGDVRGAEDGANEPSRELLVIVDAEAGGPPVVCVEQFLEGARHGFAAASPSMARASGLWLDREYHYRGLDLTALVVRPPHSAMRDAEERGGAADAVFPDPAHRQLLATVRAMEARGEAVVVSPRRMPGLHAARRPGAKTYELVGERALADLLDGWSADGTPVVTLRHFGQEAGFVRRVSDRVHGPHLQEPAAMRSAVHGSIDTVVASYSDRGELLASAVEVPAARNLMAYMRRGAA